MYLNMLSVCVLVCVCMLGCVCELGVLVLCVHMYVECVLACVSWGAVLCVHAGMCT